MAHTEQDKGASGQERLVALANEALELTRSTLLVRYRFLDRALWHMRFCAADTGVALATDARTLHFDPDAVVARFTKSPDELARDMAHSIFHCVYYHPFIRSDIGVELWNLSCDMAVERTVMDLAREAFPSPGDEERSEVLAKLEDAIGPLSAEKLYIALGRSNFDDGRLYYLRTLFARDDHSLWYDLANSGEAPNAAGDADKKMTAGGSGGQEDAAGGSDEQTDAEPPTDAPDESDEERSHDDADSDEGEPEEADAEQEDSDSEQPTQAQGEAPSPEQSEAKEQWEHISKRMAVELQSQSKRYGTQAGSLALRLGAANRRRSDYRRFLAQFSHTHEEMRQSPNEFDYIYYTFGMDTYGDIPLVEPLEYRESHKIRDFVIALDTSGSVQGDLLRTFVEETFTVLSDTQSFFSTFNVHIVQCDAVVHDDVVVHDKTELERYLQDIEIHGGGGTDFRPVFDHIDDLLQREELTNLRGVVYFTDGIGIYPSSPPDYEVAFIVSSDGYTNAPVPAWAFKFELSEFQLEEMARARKGERP